MGDDTTHDTTTTVLMQLGQPESVNYSYSELAKLCVSKTV